MQCPQCGSMLPEGLQVCYRCGASLTAPQPDAKEMPAWQPDTAPDAGKKGKKKGVAAVVALLLVAGLGFATWHFQWYQQIPFFASDNGEEPADPEVLGMDGMDPAAITAGLEAELSQAEETPSGIEEEGLAEEDEEEELPSAAHATRTGQWNDFPHVSDYYMWVQEDEEHIYFLQPSETTPAGNLYRMDPDGGNLVSMNDFVHGTEMVSSFALLEDMLYFATPVDERRSAYFRAPKAGGEGEFLFIQETSFLLAYEGELYLMLPNQLSMAVYTPDTDQLPRLSRLVQWDESAPADPPMLLNAFCLYDGWLYYGHRWEDVCSYFRANLQTGEVETLLTGAIQGESYIFDMVFDGDVCFYVQASWEGEFFVRSARVGQDAPGSTLISDVQPSYEYFPFVARTGDALVYQQGGSYLSAPLDDPTDSRERFVNFSPPFGISKEWVFLYGEIVHLETGESIYPPNAATGPRIALEEYYTALDLSQRFPDQWAVPRT